MASDPHNDIAENGMTGNGSTSNDSTSNGSTSNDLAEVEATVLDILGETLEEPVDVLRSNRVLAAHEWDSITSLLTLAQLESHFGVTLDLRSYHAARTVDDLVSLVRSQPRAQPLAQPRSTAGRGTT